MMQVELIEQRDGLMKLRRLSGDDFALSVAHRRCELINTGLFVDDFDRPDQ